MLHMKFIKDWDSEMGEIPNGLEAETKAWFIDGFKEWKLEQNFGVDEGEFDSWEDYLQIVEEDIGTMSVLEHVMESYIKLHKLKSAFFDVYLQPNDDSYKLVIYQVVPQSTEELQELIEVFAEAKNIPLPEVFTDRIISELR